MVNLFDLSLSAKIDLYILEAASNIAQLAMERDLNLWGIFAMPVGLLICFGPALLVWIRAEVKESRAQTRDRKR